MIKKLDILVLRSFIGPFIATFFLTLFVLILQFFWLWIDDYVGKGIDAVTILTLMLYLSATLVPLALPLAILLSSIMTFGNLGETFELVAIKSAGIGLLRFMRPLLITALLLSGLAFLFNNYVIPVANLKMKTLHTDLVNKKPAFDLKEGQFYNNIPGYSIKVASKNKDSLLTNVIIFENTGYMQDHIIVADKGIMRVSADKRFLEFILQNGWRYQEKNDGNYQTSEYTRMGFKEYRKAMDLSALMLNRTSDSVFKDRYEMLSVRQLNKAIDSLDRSRGKYIARTRQDLIPYIGFMKYRDTGWIDVKVTKPKGKYFVDHLPQRDQILIVDQTTSFLNSIKTAQEISATDFQNSMKEVRLHKIEWHNKFTMSIAVLVLFLIGAPLGSIVRKGGLGTPVIFAVLFFVIFFLLNNFGKKFVKEGVMDPFSGMWLATFVLLPVGFFLIYKALNDSQLFNKDFYQKIRRSLASLRKKKEAALPLEN